MKGTEPLVIFTGALENNGLRYDLKNACAHSHFSNDFRRHAFQRGTSRAQARFRFLYLVKFITTCRPRNRKAK
ncbi:MAG: hypothetical protein BWY75_03560 [bacterium ADurb.Bin425]|nr:MAG: hypothetical protein BWY75_03560 [bacterium ADurb.Bin425]